MKTVFGQAQSHLTVRELLDWGINELSFLGPRQSQTNAEVLLEEILSQDRFFLYLNSSSELPEDLTKRFRQRVEARKLRIPLEYLTGRAHFWNETLAVGPGCLIPRPETELLVEKFIERSGFATRRSFTFLDLGSGSGAIGIALLRHFENAQAAFSDISEAALNMTRTNLERYQLLSRSKVILSDLFENMRGIKWEAILSNPPYIAQSDFAGLEPEVLQEPARALDGGVEGYDFYRKISTQAADFLTDSGQIYFEIGKGQAQTVVNSLKYCGFVDIEVHKDFSETERLVIARTHVNPRGSTPGVHVGTVTNG